MSIYLGTDLISGISTNTISNAHFLFEPAWSDHLISDMSYLRADTFSWHNGAAYTLAYNELVTEYTNASSTTETEGSITFKRTVL